AEALKISALTAFCRTLRTRLDSLLSWYAYPISTGPLEGMNNKIKTLKCRSYGFRDPTYFRLKILNIHQTRYALVG
ncbi:MAG: transposase, partial [Thermoguttaceae bacterium]|nr:transposase [Thermoguttaceae bacterium]